MKKYLLHFILLVSIFGISSCSHHERVVFATKSSKRDLKFCLKNYGYPPNLPDSIYWIKPDTTGISNLKKERLAFKYNFDPTGKVAMYYYQGSLNSGIFPLPYSFTYDKNKPELVTQIDDVFYKTKYQINYDTQNNINWIEKLDSLDKRIEILHIKIK